MSVTIEGGDKLMIKDNPPANGLDYVMRVRGITTEVLAKEVGVAPKTVNAWRKAENLPQKDRRKDVSDALGESEYFLFFQEDRWENGLNPAE